MSFLKLDDPENIMCLFAVRAELKHFNIRKMDHNAIFIEKFSRMFYLALPQTPYIFMILERVYLSSNCKKAAKIFRIV